MTLVTVSVTSRHRKRNIGYSCLGQVADRFFMSLLVVLAQLTALGAINFGAAVPPFEGNEALVVVLASSENDLETISERLKNVANLSFLASVLCSFGCFTVPAT